MRGFMNNAAGVCAIAWAAGLAAEAPGQTARAYTAARLGGDASYGVAFFGSGAVSAYHVRGNAGISLQNTWSGAGCGLDAGTCPEAMACAADDGFDLTTGMAAIDVASPDPWGCLAPFPLQSSCPAVIGAPFSAVALSGGASSGYLSWGAGGFREHDWSRATCADEGLGCGMETAARLCASLAGEMTFTGFNASDDADGEITIESLIYMSLNAAGESASLFCGEPSVEEPPPVLTPAQRGSVSLSISIEGPSLPGEAAPYARTLLLHANVWAAASSAGAGDLAVDYVTDLSSTASDFFVEVNLGAGIVTPSADTCGGRTMISSFPEYGTAAPSSQFSRIRVKLGRKGAASETWKVTLRKSALLESVLRGDLAGAGTPPGCPAGCGLPGLRPDGVVNLKDLRALYASLGKSSTDCEYVRAADLDRDGVVTEAEVEALQCSMMLDVNNDAFIDQFDYMDYDALFNSDNNCEADINGDGFVDFFDYGLYVMLFDANLPGCEASPVAADPVCAS